MELLGKLKRHWPLQKGTEKMTFNGRRGVFWPWCDSSHIHCSREPREGKLPSPPDKKVHLIKKSLPDKKMLSALQKCKGAKYIHRPPQKWPSLSKSKIQRNEGENQNKLLTFSALYGKALQDPLPVPAPSFWLEAKCKSKSTAMPTPPRTHIWKHKYNSTEIQTQNTNNMVKDHASQIPSIGRRRHIKPTIYKSDR